MRKLFCRHVVKFSWRIACLGLVSTVIQLLAGSCVQIQELEGGPKDTIPPKLINAYPEHLSTGFRDNKIQLTFDKHIEVQDIYNQLIITPRLAKPADKPSYTYKVRGKTLQLTLASALKEETTYTFNFKDANKDTREGTAAENPTIIFSTGDQLDSMYVTGKVKQLMTAQPVSNALVALYKVTEEDTALVHILNNVPDYFTHTNVDGDFKLTYIKQGKYRICAGYSEENKLIIDPSKEAYGFLAAPLDLVEPSEELTLSIAQANAKDFEIKSKKTQGPYFEINFSKPVVKYTLALTRKPKRFREAYLYSNLIEDGATIRVYNTLGLLREDSLSADLMAEDAMGNVIEKTISIHFNEVRTTKEPFQYAFTPASGTQVPLTFEGKITFSKPIRSVHPDGLFFIAYGQDTIHINPQDLHLNTQRNIITIQKKFNPTSISPPIEGDTTSEQHSDLILHVAQGACISVDKELNAAASYQYNFKTPEKCGTIRGRVITKAPGFIIQLLNNKYEVVDEIRNKPYYRFQKILPGNYRIRVLVLQAPNATWRFGDINHLQAPDPVIFYPYELTIVANWEVDYIDLVF